MHYGLSIEIVRDRGKHFLNEVIEHLLDEFMIIHIRSHLLTTLKQMDRLRAQKEFFAQL